jgi:serine/threonine protein kinase
MANWKEIHPDFTEELQKEWEDKGFSYEECKKWIEVGLTTNDTNFTSWLKDIKKLLPENLLNNTEELKGLRGEFNSIKNWTEVHKAFGEKSLWDTTFQQFWENWGFTYWDAQEWIKIGREPNDYWKVWPWKDCDFTPQQAKEWVKVNSIGWGDSYFCAWLRDIKQLDADSVLDRRSILQLRDEYREYEKNLKISSETIDQIKDFDTSSLTSQQEELVNQLILDLGLRRRYKWFGLCLECQQPNNWMGSHGKSWCWSCSAKHFQDDFSNWTSGNPEIDKLIQKCQLEADDPNKILEWIPYENFTNVEYLAEGGFGKVYKSEWKGYISYWNAEKKEWERTKNNAEGPVVLKSVNNSKETTGKFLQEIVNNKLIELDESEYNAYSVIECYAISQDPVTKDYLMVTDYVGNGNLRQYLRKNYNEISFEKKLFQLYDIIGGLKLIHNKEMIHHDFHPGNIVIGRPWKIESCLITDLGLSRSASETNEGTVYGVLPYVAPEVLHGGSSKYTQASDIYSFGVIACELLTNAYPYNDISLTDTSLASKVCQGLRPSIDKIFIPRLLKDLIKRCWDADPKKRPTVNELFNTFSCWIKKDIDEQVIFYSEKLSLKEAFSIKENTEFYQQYQEIKDKYNQFSQNTPYKFSSLSVTHSQLINTQEIARLFQASQEKALKEEIKKIEREINQPLTDEQKKLVSNFIQVKKLTIKDEADESTEDQAWDLEDKLKEQDLTDENIEKIMKYCERFVKAEQQLEANIEIPTN